MKIDIESPFAAYLSTELVRAFRENRIPADQLAAAAALTEQLNAGVLADMKSRPVPAPKFTQSEDPADRTYSLSKIYTDAQVLRLVSFRDVGGLTFREAGRRAGVNENTAHELYRRGKRFFGAVR